VRTLWAFQDRPAARALATSALFVLSWSFLHVGVYARVEPKLDQDVSLYRFYADEVRAGAVPYRGSFTLEYPPGALPAFIPAAWAGRDYAGAFEVQMLACGATAAFLIGFTAPALPSLVFAGISPLLVGDLMRARYDWWPALLLTAAMVALLRDRHRVGWALLGAAVAAKAYPLCVVPLAAVWTARRAGRAELARAIAWGAGVVAAAFLPFVVVAPHGVWETVWTQFSRPLEFESLGGAILMASRRAVTVFGAGSINVAGTPAQLLAWGGTIAEVAALAWCWVGFARGVADAERFSRFAAASVCAFVAFGKVLSPQFLIWLVPMVALVRGRASLPAIGVFSAACLLTLWYFPDHFGDYALKIGWTPAVVLARDVLLVALFAVLAWPPRRDRAARALAAAPS
jgi:hypothetical protein